MLVLLCVKGYSVRTIFIQLRYGFRSTSTKENEKFDYWEDSDDSCRDPDFIPSDEELQETGCLVTESNDKGKES